MRRNLLYLRFDGTRYHGWQVQPNGITVQETLQDAIERVTGVRAGVTGCSRTDAGVHANMFCCTFDTQSRLSPDTLIRALNAYLPRDIAVYRCREVAAAFHPRYAALGKRYVYKIWNSPVRNPFQEGYALSIRAPLDEMKMHEAAQDFVGTHAFAACQAASAHPLTDTVRNVAFCTVQRQGDLVLFTVQANGFLYNMVRIMTGTLLDMAAGRIAWHAIPSILESERRENAGATAAACGLYLEEVLYPT